MEGERCVSLSLFSEIPVQALRGYVYNGYKWGGSGARNSVYVFIDRGGPPEQGDTVAYERIEFGQCAA